MNKVNYITVTEFQNMNPETDFTGFSDVTISGMISRASQNIDNFLQYSLGVEDIVGEKNEAMVSSNGNLIVYTAKSPIISVSAVALKLGTAVINLSMADGNGVVRYDIPWRAKSFTYPYQEIAFTGTLSIRNFYSLRGTQIFTTVSYRAGYETIPDDVKDACNLWTKDVFVRQSNPMNLTSMTQGAISMGFGSPDSDTGESRWVKQAKGILQSYRRVTA